jgi:phosphate transport system substrate-binding protein
MRAAVGRDEAGIAYLSLGYVDSSVKALLLNGIQPTMDNVKNNTYPIIRTLWLITNGPPDELEMAYLRFYLSQEGQKVVQDLGYIPV